jgi:hypothetical protein
MKSMIKNRHDELLKAVDAQRRDIPSANSAGPGIGVCAGPPPPRSALG